MSVTITRTDDFDTCLAIRTAVFVHEQGVPADIENDEYDAGATHLLALRDGKAVGTARIVQKGDIGKIGRVCVLREERGTGLGAALINAALDDMRNSDGFSIAILGAQIVAIPFYEKLGFTAYGDDFEDAGIAHRMMERTL